MRRLRPSALIVAALAAFSFAAFWTNSLAASPASQPAAATQPSLEDAINQLGDPDPGRREAATRQLWLAGKLAEPLLKAAAAGDDPETARRCAEILKEFSLGLLPDTPPDVIALLEQFHTDDQQRKLDAIQGLSTRGVAGGRVLLALRRDEKDPLVQSAIYKALASHAHEAAALLIGDEDLSGAEELLRGCIGENPACARDEAAILLLHGGLDARLAQLKAATQPANTMASATELMYLARAKGDLEAARAAAQRRLELATAAANQGDSEPNPVTSARGVIEQILCEEKNWPVLAQRLQKRAQTPEDDFQPIEDLGYATAYARLSGDVAGEEKASVALRKFGESNITYLEATARALLLNDRSDAAIGLLLKHHGYLLAQQLLKRRLQYQKALELSAAAAATADQKLETLRLRAGAVDILRLVGDRDGAAKALADVASANASAHDFGTWVLLTEAAQNMGDRASVDQFLRQALTVGASSKGVEELLIKAGIREPELMTRWWAQLRAEHGGGNIDKTNADFVPLAEGRLLGEELDRVAAQTEQWAMKQGTDRREFALALVALTLQAANRNDDASALLLRWVAAGAGPRALVGLGDMQVAAKRFGQAAATYERSWQMDRSQPVPLYLQGWALTQAGDAARGQPLMKMADLLALGGDVQRYQLFMAMRRNGCTADADRERELMIRLSGFASWHRCEVLRLSGADASARGDFAAATEDWEQAFLPAFTRDRAVPQLWENARIAALLHRTRALELLRKGDAPAALREARVCLDDSPGNADAMIELANAFASGGHPVESDAVFTQTIDLLRKSVQQYPNSGSLHNSVAWAQTQTHRELDDALAHARRAVELEPSSTASLDTLGEACFLTGDAAGAIKAMQRCIELEPSVARHREQLARFSKQRTQPSTSPN